VGAPQLIEYLVEISELSTKNQTPEAEMSQVARVGRKEEISFAEEAQTWSLEPLREAISYGNRIRCKALEAKATLIRLLFSTELVLLRWSRSRGSLSITSVGDRGHDRYRHPSAKL
jgi:hypothetical protein